MSKTICFAFCHSVTIRTRIAYGPALLHAHPQGPLQPTASLLRFSGAVRSKVKSTVCQKTAPNTTGATHSGARASALVFPQGPVLP